MSSPLIRDHQRQLRLVAKQTEALARAFPGPQREPAPVPSANEVAAHLAALQLIQAIAVKSAAERTPYLPLDPVGTTAARRSARALAHANLQLSDASQQLAALLDLAVAADVWRIPAEDPDAARAGQLYRQAATTLRTAARQLSGEADHLPESGIAHSPVAASRPFAARIRRALRIRSAEPLPPTSPARTAARPARR